MKPWLRWVLPSFSDLFFLVLLGILAFSGKNAALLRDADIGWHIRTGEIIAGTRSIPRSDPFSYTRPGATWYAWEWLYDWLIAILHHLAGLRGVVFFTATLLAATFALLFHFVLLRSGNLLLAAVLTLLAVATAQVHMLARPHVVSWLFALLWMEFLCRFEEGQRSALLWLPLWMLFWVNLHGGFVLGLVLLAIFLLGNLKGGCEKLVPLGAVLGACALATFLTPYGYHLPIHVYQYLSDSFLMNSIEEFASPNFHLPVYGYFELLVLLAIAAAAVGREHISPSGWITLAYSIVTGLYSVRNLPISAILMTLVLARPLGRAVARRHAGEPDRPFRGHILSACVLLASIFLITCAPPMHFDDKMIPVKATSWIAQRGIRDHLFSTDAWSGYLIYQLYPRFHVFMDDRHDFYGRAFVEEYGKAMLATPDWRKPLEQYQVKWALLPPDCPLATLMRESPDWRVAYEDNVAVVFSR